MVDRVYKSAIPDLRKSLELIRREFAPLHPRTDWVRLRVNPVLRHARELERLVSAGKFSGAFARLTKGVSLFHSDLVYLRTNVKDLQKLLDEEKRRQRR